MYAKSLVIAATLAAMAGVANQAHAQYGMDPYGGYGYAQMPPPGMMPGGGLPGMTPPPGMMSGVPGVMPAGFAGGYGGGPQCAAPSCADPACGVDGGCGCGSGSCNDCCKGWCHRINVFGEFLYMRPRDAEVAYAVAIDGSALTPDDPVYQAGRVQVVDPDYQPGFRIGAGFTLDECSAIVVTYAQLDADASDDVTVPGGIGAPLIRSLVSPIPANAATDGLDASADLFVQFKTLDVDYKGLFAYCDDYKAAYVVGVRYAKLNQEFDAVYSVNGFDNVATDVEFEGAGVKFGLEGERYGRNKQWFVYGRGSVSAVGGEFRNTYFSSSQADSLIVDTAWKAGRLVTITDVEFGLGWQNYCGNFRLSAGYMYSTWFNVVRTNDWIDAVQQNNFTDRSDNFNGMMTFDGLTARAEILW